MNENDMPLVFVYGSLRKHEGNHRLLSAAERMAAQCWTDGLLYDTGYGFPAMMQSSGDRVYGELYRVTPEILQRLDALEGYYGEDGNNHYWRIMQTVHTDSGEVKAFTYVYLEETRELKCIDYGDWKYHRMNQSNELFYFAYGSCMDDERFKQANTELLFQNVLGRGVLKDYELKFTRKASDGGRADIMEIGGVVEGKVYRIGQEALAYLLIREGVKGQTYRLAFVDIQMGDQIVNDALTFLVVNKSEEESPPPDHYLAEIFRGGKTVWSNEYEQKFEEKVRMLNCTIVV